MTPIDVDLSGTWTLREAAGGPETPCPVPGDAITALVADGRLPEPYEGMNELDCRWVSERDWTLSRSFEMRDADGLWMLEAEGLDTVVELRVNGTVVLSCDNAFRRFRAPMPEGLLRAGTNGIELRFASAPREARRRQAAQRFRVPYQAENCPIPDGNMLRKPECDFGWDWNLALAPFGVTGGLRLRRVARALPRDVRVRQDHAPGHVTVTVEARLDRRAPGPLPYAIAFAGERREGTTEADRVTETFEVSGPDLWWPAGYGAQTLHDLTVELDGRTEHRRVGLRKVALVSEPDEHGRSFGLSVNGRPVFCKGANWIPADALSGRITREATADLLRSAAQANMNMIRVWGGGRYEADWFYDLCDEMGLMVWQDAMFACHLYPCDDAFLSEVSREVEEQAARLQHHACLALWCGDNELVGALNWYPESRADRDRYLVAYDRLNRTVEQAVRAGDPDAAWWPSSPSPGPLSFGDAWHDDGSGDMHFWSVWHEGRDFDHYRDVAPRFCSEFGFQSYPSMDVIRRFARPEDRNIASPVMEHHQRNEGGNARIAETMFRTFRWPERFEDFVWLSQLQQGLAIETAVTHWRSCKPRCQGTLYWQLNDTWPGCSWSSLDHGGGWKLMHHMARRFYAPSLVTAVPDEEAIRVVAVSDRPGRIRMTVRARALAMSGALRDLGDTILSVGPDAPCDAMGVEANALGPDEVLLLDWDGPDPGRAVHAPRPWKTYDLPAARLASLIRAEEGGWRLDLKVEAPCFFATAEADMPGRWSDAALPCLLPGETATLRFRPSESDARPAFLLRDLRSATMTKDPP